MYIFKDKIFNNTEGYNKYCRNNINYYYTPVIFTSDTKSGEETIKRIAFKYENEGKIDFKNILGAYHVIVEDLNRKEILAFTDNSGQRCFYFNDNCISDRFLQLIDFIKSEGLNLEFDEEKLIEYIYFGKNFSCSTYIKGITKSNSQFYYKISENGDIIQLSKNIGTLNSSSFSIDVNRFSSILKKNLMSDKSLDNKTLSLTGGFDSRYVLSMIDDPSLRISIYTTENENLKDEIISHKISTILKKDFENIVLSNPHYDDNDIVDCFYKNDGYMSMFINLDFSYCMYAFLNYLSRNKDCKILFTGDTGTLHKDEHWKEEFPNYNKKHTNEKRYYYNRIRPIYGTNIFSNKAKSIIADVELNIQKWLNNNIQDINTKSIDYFEYYLNRQSFVPVYYNNKSQNIETYAPLLEYSFVINAYNQERKYRKRGKYMIDFITRMMPDVAKVPTVLGTTTSSENKYKVKDSLLILRGYMIKAIRLIGRKIFKANLLNSRPTWSMYNDILEKSELKKSAVNFFVKSGYIKKDTSDNINYSILSRLIESYLMYEIYTIDIKNKIR